MSTVDLIGNEMKKNISEIQALAVTVMNAPASVDADLKSLYEQVCQQPTLIPTDLDMPKMEESDLAGSKVTTNLTGEDTSVANWAVRVVPSISEALTDAGAADDRDDLLKIVRQAAFDLVQREMINCYAY